MTMPRYKAGPLTNGRPTILSESGEWVLHTDALAFAAQEYDRALEDAAKIAHYYADQDYCAMNYPEEGGIAASGTAHQIAAAILAMKKGNTDEA
jgi:hypothetical protein